MRESTREIERSSRRRVDGVLVIVIYALASTVSGSRSLAHATTRAEAFCLCPTFEGSNMPVNATGAGGRRTMGFSAGWPWLLLSS